jgi:hypothetical protein
MHLAKKQAFIRRKAEENLADPEGKYVLPTFTGRMAQ